MGTACSFWRNLHPHILSQQALSGGLIGAFVLGLEGRCSWCGQPERTPPSSSHPPDSPGLRNSEATPPHLHSSQGDRPAGRGGPSVRPQLSFPGGSSKGRLQTWEMGLCIHLAASLGLATSSSLAISMGQLSSTGRGVSRIPGLFPAQKAPSGGLAWSPDSENEQCPLSRMRPGQRRGSAGDKPRGTRRLAFGKNAVPVATVSALRV